MGIVQQGGKSGIGPCGTGLGQRQSDTFQGRNWYSACTQNHKEGNEADFEECYVHTIPLNPRIIYILTCKIALVKKKKKNLL